MSVCKVKIWSHTVGYLYWDKCAVFEPEDTYKGLPFNLAPIIHPEKNNILSGNDFHPNFQGMIPCFQDSLPDAFGNAVFNSWLGRSGNASMMNPVDRLLYVGSRGMGALEYEVANPLPNTDGDIHLNEIAAIADHILNGKFDNIETEYSGAFANLLRVGSSAGGAQAKILIAIDNDGRNLPGDKEYPFQVQHWILKLQHDRLSKWGRDKMFVESVYNAMAKECGIVCAEHKLFEHSGLVHFGSLRFDRLNNAKIHMQTIHALTGFYGRNHEFSYTDIFRVLESLNVPYQDREQLFLRMVFNVASGNRDDHTKNFSMCMGENGAWTLSPAYDLTYPFNPINSFVVPHQISINGKNLRIERNDLLATAKLAGITKAEQLIDHVCEVVSNFQDYIAAFAINPQNLQFIWKDITSNIQRLQNPNHPNT
jgi:serine/threonine-protein kinase HipA